MAQPIPQFSQLTLRMFTLAGTHGRRPLVLSNTSMSDSATLRFLDVVLPNSGLLVSSIAHCQSLLVLIKLAMLLLSLEIKYFQMPLPTPMLPLQLSIQSPLSLVPVLVPMSSTLLVLDLAPL